MFTNLEGSWDEVMAVIKECTELVGREAGRASVVIKIDYRPGAPEDRMAAKVEAVEARLRADEPHRTPSVVWTVARWCTHGPGPARPLRKGVQFRNLTPPSGCAVALREVAPAVGSRR